MTVFDLINKDILCSCGKTHRCNIEKLEIGELIKLDSPHYIHDIEYERIAEEARLFVEDL